MKRLSSLLFVSALSLSSLSAATVFSSGLPTTGGDVFQIASGGTVGAFTVGGGGVDLLTSSDAQYSNQLCAGISCVDLDGTVSSSTPGGTVSGTVTLTPGTYTLTFDLFAAQRSTTASSTVTLSGPASLVNTTYTDGTFTPGLQTINITVVTGGSYTLEFASKTPGFYGDLVGGVAINSPVPEPSTMLLMSLPLLAFGSRMFRRSRG